jgi:membrane associated rhomboid family serine protease/antitoxin component YwqK of YwqJK toxin-antitoxin module
VASMKPVWKSAPVTLIVTVAIVAVFIAMLVVGVDVISPSVRDVLHFGGMLDAFLEKGEWWRLFSASFVHGGIIHAAANVVSLWFLGRMFEFRYGSWNLLLVYLSGVVVSGLGSYYFNVFVVTCGASGGIMAIAGCTIPALFFDRKIRSGDRNAQIIELVFAILLNVGLGFYLTVIDNAAHLTGLFWGLLVGVIMFSAHHVSTSTNILKSTAIVVLMGLIFYGVVPRKHTYRYWYYVMFNSFIKNDMETVELLNSNSNPENPTESIAGINEASIIWNQNQKMLDLFKQAPDKLTQDVPLLRQIFHLREKGLKHLKQYVITGDLAFIDSVGSTNLKIKELPPIKYWLYFDENPKPESSGGNDTIETTPVTIWYDSLWQVTAQNNAAFYREGTMDYAGNAHGAVEDYFLNGTLQMKGFYNRGIKDGHFFYYNENGTYSSYGCILTMTHQVPGDSLIKRGMKSYDMAYSREGPRYLDGWNKDGVQTLTGGNGYLTLYYPGYVVSDSGGVSFGMKQGVWIGYHADKSPYYREWYENGILKKGKSRDTTNAFFLYDKIYLEPRFPNGKEAWMEYVKNNLKYPENVSDSIIPPTIFYHLTVNEKGIITYAEPVRRYGYGFEKEAGKLLNERLIFEPAYYRGQIDRGQTYVVFDFGSIKKTK